MYAIEAGVTLTTLLLLADMGKITDTTWLSLFFMALGLISIHGERMFSPAEDSDFPRRRFGLPLFWSGHVQIAASLLLLLGSQLLGWLVEPVRQLSGFEWAGNLLTSNYLLAAGVWLAGMYAYLYSDIVVRRIGVYLALAGVCLVMAEITLMLGFDVRAEWILAAMAITSVAINLAHRQWPGVYKHVDRFVPPLGMAARLRSGILGSRAAHPCNQRRGHAARLVVLHWHGVPRRHADHGRGESRECLPVSAFRS